MLAIYSLSLPTHATIITTNHSSSLNASTVCTSTELRAVCGLWFIITDTCDTSHLMCHSSVQ
jgi:hypothetical protein